MHIEKYIQKYSHANQKLGQAIDAKINHIINPQ